MNKLTSILLFLFNSTNKKFMRGFNFKKAVQTLNYFAIKEGGKINKMKAIKLVWLSNRNHLRKFGRLIFDDRYYAMKLGPVPSYTKDLAEVDTDFLAEDELTYRNQYISPIDQYSYASKSNIENLVFSDSDLKSLEDIYTRFGNLTEFQLSELSHQYPEWKRFEDLFNSGMGSRYEIDILDFFENTVSIKDDFFAMDKEDIELSKEAFLERCEYKTI